MLASQTLNLDEYMSRWRLEPDGEPIVTHASRLLPVRCRGVPAMLKIATAPEERFGGKLMVWWDGDGAAKVLAHDGEALLLERATGERSLVRMAERGSDDEATQVICEVAARLHERKPGPLPELVPLRLWFQALEPAAAQHGGILRLAAGISRDLLATEREPVLLHGDLHHGNVLDFGERGWLVIDPKGLLGERSFDYVNLLRNPSPALALAPGRFERQVELISDVAELDPRRFLEWTLAFSCLSAAWILADRDAPELDLAVARKAASALGLST